MVMKIAPRVRAAIRARRPVVALESTVISHGGLPFPQNYELGRELEETVRFHGALPATIGVIGGKVVVGMNEEELKTMANVESEVMKCSTRDLAYVAARGKNGSTTVAASIAISRRAGIEVFATGGLGGVHRGAFSPPEPSLDVSADLLELSRTPQIVVCAGIKSILDVGGTLEWLEAHAVGVGTYSDSHSFPLFFSNGDDRYKAPIAFGEDPVLVARTYLASSRALGLSSSLVVAVPNPSPIEGMEATIEKALAECNRKGIRGKEVTPYLLKRVGELSESRSVASNIALLKNNARVGAQIAVELSKLERGKGRKREANQGIASLASRAKRKFSTVASNRSLPEGENDSQKTRDILITVIGGCALDIRAQRHRGRNDDNNTTYSRTSHPGEVRMTPGGVGRNVACGIGRLARAHAERMTSASGKTGPTVKVTMVSKWGGGVGDPGASLMEASLLDAGVNISSKSVIRSAEASTPCVVEMLDADGNLMESVADFERARMTPEEAGEALDDAALESSVVVFDGNAANLLPAFVDRLKHLRADEVSKTPVMLFEPTSVPKAELVVPHLSFFSFLTPNVNELFAIANQLDPSGGSRSTTKKTTVSTEDERRISKIRETLAKNLSAPTNSLLLERIPGAIATILPRLHFHLNRDDVLGVALRGLAVSMGPEGVILVIESLPPGAIAPVATYALHRPSLHPASQPLSTVSGAGDAQMAVFAYTWAHDRKRFYTRPDRVLDMALAAAACTLRSTESFAEDAARTVAEMWGS